MDDRPSVDGSPARRILLIGEGELADATHRILGGAGAAVSRLHDPSDGEIRDALSDDVESVIVVYDDDVVSLRCALVVENVRPGVRLLVTVYGRTVASQIERAVRNSQVVSMADIVAPTLAAPCLDDRLLSVTRTDDGLSGVQIGDGGPELVSIESARRRGQLLRANLASILRPFEPSARILMVGVFGLVLVLVAETLAVALALKQPLVEAFYATTKVLVTVGPNPAVDNGPGWFKTVSAMATLATLAFTAIFTAGIVDRLLDRRLTSIVGRRVVPRKNHVVVVGLSGVGLRLCVLLRELGLPVLAVESDPDNYNIPRARDYGLPVVIGDGGSRFLLRRLSLERARALAAVTGQQVENISIAVTALGMRSDLRTVLRAGRGEVANETRALFGIGVVRDVHRIGGTVLAAAALESTPRGAFLHEQTIYLITPGGEIERFESDGKMSPAGLSDGEEPTLTRGGSLPGRSVEPEGHGREQHARLEQQ